MIENWMISVPLRRASCKLPASLFCSFFDPVVGLVDPLFAPLTPECALDPVLQNIWGKIFEVGTRYFSPPFDVIDPVISPIIFIHLREERERAIDGRAIVESMERAEYDAMLAGTLRKGRIQLTTGCDT